MISSRRRNVHFLVCAVLLGACATFMQVAQSRGTLKVIKAALPIRKPLNDFDRKKLAPMEVINVIKLPQETVDELGTKEYINWMLAPADRAPDKAATLSVTYYTGVLDQVPHVPEECFHQNAFTQESDKVLELSLPQLGEKVEIRRLSFYPPRDLSARTYVYYTICVNGSFYGRRDLVRLQMSDPFDTHLYYSKVEVAIKERPGGTIEELDAAAGDILDKTITELMRSHWPLRGWERGGPSKGVTGSTGGQTAGLGV